MENGKPHSFLVDLTKIGKGVLSIAYPAWVDERTDFNNRLESLFAATDECLCADPCQWPHWTFEESQHLISGRPIYRLGLIDVNTFEYMTALHLFLIQSKVGAVS